MAGELVLIVEDNELNLELARDVLQHNGYQTLEARTAVEAIALASEYLPNLVLMDIQLPDTDGISTLEQLRRNAQTNTIPVVALTAFAMADDCQRLLDAGFDGYIAKPIDVALFPSQVDGFIKPPDGRGFGG